MYNNCIMHYKTHKSLHWPHPLIQEWFTNKFVQPTEPQVKGWPAILAGQTTLISAPTGSGKTFAAFLACLDQLVRQALKGELKAETEVLYISPLKALGNDIQKNLLQPLQEISALAKAHGLNMDEIRVAVRTGDTLAKDRQAMLKKPPHILITTPESFYILLTAEKSRTMLSTVKTVIIDEIHAIANDKRGAHLLLSLERLNALTRTPPIRIGLSATQKPIELIGHFLAGANRPLPVMINIGHARHLQIHLEILLIELGAVTSNEMWEEIYDRLAFHVAQNRSTLIFVNTRRLAERIAHHLTERIGKEYVAAHHGSLSRKLRLASETKLKNGELKVLVATASLELGIDIGTIDLVCQIGSSRSIAAALQRIGRAGHSHGAISRGIIFATTRDELLECAALIYAIRSGDLDQLLIPDEPLDILAQQIVAICATGDWYEDELFNLVKQAYSYRHLTGQTFDAIIHMLSAGIAGARGRYGAYLMRDEVHGMVKARRGSRINAITNGGAIPDNALFTVVEESQGVVVGTLDEEFAVESNRDDIILLGSTSWRIHRIDHRKGKVLVEDAHGAPPSVPFWQGEAANRTKELSLQVSQLREKLNDMLPHHTSLQEEFTKQPEIVAAIHWLETQCGMTKFAAEQLIKYLLSGRAVLGVIPTQKTIVAERFFDEAGGMQLIIHAPFGAKINKAWGLALRKRFCRSFNFELQAAATDDGLNISLAEQHSFPLADVFQFLHPNTLKDVLTQAVLQSPLFATRFRWDAGRFLALPRFRNGKKIPPNIQRMLADDLLAAVFPDAAACQDNLGGRDLVLPHHPLIDETMKDALTEALDLAGLMDLLKNILAGKIECVAVDTPMPSPFAQQILNANPYAFLDDAPLEERRARAVEMRRYLSPADLQNIGRLDPKAIVEIKEQISPDIRNADELHDLLQTLIAFPYQDYCQDQKICSAWQAFFAELSAANRAVEATVKQKKFWVAMEKMKSFKVIYPDAFIKQTLLDIEKNSLTEDEIILNVLRGWLFLLGPVTQIELSILLSLDPIIIEQALIKLETSGFILRGHFRTLQDEPLEWCERRVLARIHRLTINKLRKEIEPVMAHQFINWLLRWQHVAPQTQLQGENGLFAVLKQLQGFELPAHAWERLLAKRISDYHEELLDRLILSGTIGFGRISLHPALKRQRNTTTFLTKRRVMPTRLSPIAFFVRDEMDWFPSYSYEEMDLTSLSHAAEAIYFYLKDKGASFFADIAHHVPFLKSTIEMALWELTAAGLVTADRFDNLRSLMDPKRRLSKQRRKNGYQSPRHATARWSLLHKRVQEGDREKQLESSCLLLLNRYGVVFRDLLSKENILPPWRELLPHFRRLEESGEIRGGRFVKGFNGEQFALPYAVESLRSIRNLACSQSQLSTDPDKFTFLDDNNNIDNKKSLWLVLLGI